MASQRIRAHVFKAYAQSLQGIGVAGFFAAFSREAGTGLSQLCLRLTGGLLHAVICLLIGEGRQLAEQVLDYQRLLDIYCLLASVAPLLHCFLGLQ